jgi:hypothetical protein
MRKDWSTLHEWLADNLSANVIILYHFNWSEETKKLMKIYQPRHAQDPKTNVCDFLWYTFVKGVEQREDVPTF